MRASSTPKKQMITSSTPQRINITPSLPPAILPLLSPINIEIQREPLSTRTSRGITITKEPRGEERIISQGGDLPFYLILSHLIISYHLSGRRSSFLSYLITSYHILSSLREETFQEQAYSTSLTPPPSPQPSQAPHLLSDLCQRFSPKDLRAEISRAESSRAARPMSLRFTALTLKPVSTSFLKGDLANYQNQ